MFRKIKKILFPPEISYGITVCNEYKEIELLLKFLIPLIDKKDEIIILKDITKPCKEVDEVLERYQKHILVIEAKLDGDFASFKNNLIKKARKDYLFQIDADELLQEALLKDVKKILKKYYRCEIFAVPRINIVHGITPEHILKWNWEVDDDQYINYPDYQERIFKLGKGIHWVNKVHERLKGSTKIKHIFSETKELCIIHEKNIERQEMQNKFYDTL